MRRAPACLRVFPLPPVLLPKVKKFLHILRVRLWFALRRRSRFDAVFALRRRSRFDAVFALAKLRCFAVAQARLACWQKSLHF